MGIISIVNNKQDVTAFCDLISEVLKDPKAWKSANDELKAAVKLVDEASRAGETLGELNTLKVELDKKEQNLAEKQTKAEELISKSNAIKSEAEAEKAEVTKALQELAEAKQGLINKEIALEKAEANLKAEVEKNKVATAINEAKQVELDSLIAKHKAALEAALAASV